MGKVLKKKKRNANETRILVRIAPGGPLYRIAKIFGPNDGGFTLFPSMHINATGHVLKSPINYSLVENAIALKDIGRKFTASTPVKLSYHPSGLAQFSAAGGSIVSGTNEAGQIKGVGLYTHPLSRPITSGPAAAILAWGIEEFNIEQDTENGVMIFDVPSLECCDSPLEEVNAVKVNFFTIPKSQLQYATRDAGRRIFTNVYIHNRVRRAFDLRVIELPCKKIFLGVWAHRTKAQFNNVSSGWSMGGPGKSRPYTGEGYVLNAVYPSPFNDDSLNEMQSLEFSIDNPVPPDTDTDRSW